ncbi:unnamed protein product, partial [Ixodes persulcatus]
SVAHLVHHRGLQVDEDCPGHILARPSGHEEGVEGVLPAAHQPVVRHLAVGLDAMLKAVKLPAGVADLHTRLAHVHRDTLAHVPVGGAVERAARSEGEKEKAGCSDQERRMSCKRCPKAGNRGWDTGQCTQKTAFIGHME